MRHQLPVFPVRYALLTLVLLFAAAGCSKDSNTPASGPPAIRVVVTTNIVADWVENIGGDRVEVFSLVPGGADPHAFRPGAQDVAKVADADLVLSIGLGLEESWLGDLLQNTAADPSKIVELGEIVGPIEFGAARGRFDPHFWFDPVRVKLAVSDIAGRLAALDPEQDEAFRANASAYGARLDELHAWTAEQAALLPEDRRLLVTSHDSLGYFARVYGFEVVGVILSGTTEVEASAESLAGLVEVVKERDVPAVFGETTVSERVAAAIATESGATLVRLYSGSLGAEGSGAETYAGMVRTNVERIVEALR